MAEHIPTTQKAAVFSNYGGKIEIKEVPVPEIEPDDMLVKILYTGVCHSDLHIWLGDFPFPTKPLPLIGGHEGAGIVVKTGANVKNFKVGDRAGVKWINATCLCCEYCKRGYETNCENMINSGFTRDGTFQQYAVVRGTEAAPIPEGLDMAKVAPILCAGVTVYKALKTSKVKAGQIVAITGAGGGLGSCAIQYAKAMGMRVLALDTSAKEEHCRSLGADLFLDPFKCPDIVSAVQLLTSGGPHGVINLAASVRAMDDAAKYVRTRGVVVLIALPPDAKMSIEVIPSIVRTITVTTSAVGSRQDVDEALEFFARGQIKIPVEIATLEDLPKTFERMQKCEISGRVVLDMWK
ncbi:unnamed protein product [Bursaphelenchus xylophilus]|uniref:alcohol dehydrogenase n=1 Tax=Bursaphelenchus xylophilus TaxID=6326 RepID=A0A1I7SXA3_BURXY|nr:unnamed protein product [Bursaphelenchus xylophilus]CAG9100284.1 unnamed protein product [Bursaphelenchus xylophilus]